MTGSSKPSITIIGTGALGSTLDQFFKESDYKIISTWNSRGGVVFSDESGGYQKKSSAFPKNDSEIGELIFITTPDDFISKVVHILAEQSILWRGKSVVHCSGNLTSEELNVLSGAGSSTASMHPIQTFTKGDGAERFKDIYISLQGDSKAKDQLKTLIEKMGANYILLNKKQKRFLHIAAVMASNYLVALMFSVEKLLKDVQLDEGLDILQPLIRQTVNNIFENGSVNALTGPISRGDRDSVQTHLEELQEAEQEKLYKILGLEALKIAGKSGNLSPQQLNDLNRLLKDQ